MINSVKFKFIDTEYLIDNTTYYYSNIMSSRWCYKSVVLKEKNDSKNIFMRL